MTTGSGIVTASGEDRVRILPPQQIGDLGAKRFGRVGWPTQFGTGDAAAIRRGDHRAQLYCVVVRCGERSKGNLAAAAKMA
jgi:hypothetical protein